MKLLRSKIAVAFYFLSGGGSLALWAVHIPLIQEKVGVDYSALGLLLMVSGLGGFVSMQLAGWMVDHIGAKTTTMLGGITIAVSLLGPAFANNPFTLGLAIFGIGFGLSAVDVPMNAAALQVERANKRPIFTFFHLFWSLGGLIGAAIGFATIRAGLTQDRTLLVASIFLAAMAVLMSFWLLPNEAVASNDDKAANKASTKANRRVLGFVILAGLMSASGALIEGVAQDWGALYLIDIQGATVAAAAWGLATFNIGMILGRIFIDRIVETRGRRFVVVYGSLLAAAAIFGQGFSHNYELSLVLWGLLGLGVSGVVPQLFAAAAEIGEPSHSGRNMAKVVGITYAGGLAGPSIIGLLTNFVPLNIAIGWGVLLGLFVALAYSKLEKLPQ